MIQFLYQIDVNILIFVQEHIRNPIATPLLKLITSMGDGGVVWLALILWMLCFKKTRKTGIAAMTALVICYLMNDFLLKNIIARSRPFDVLQQLHILIKPPTDYSFPSGHTSISFAVAGTIWILENKWWRLGTILLACTIGFSRIYVGVHYPSDVICGAVEGILISLLVCTYIRYRSVDRNIHN